MSVHKGGLSQLVRGHYDGVPVSCQWEIRIGAVVRMIVHEFENLIV